VESSHPVRSRFSSGTLPADTVARLRVGDPVAFDAVYEAYRARLYSFLLRLTHDEPLARDLSQETWLRLAASARQLTPDTEPSAWLFRVARNVFLSQRRWLVVHRASLATLRFILPDREEPSPFDRVVAGALELRLERALAALPLRYREVVLLISVEGFDAPQVAEMLGLSQTAVRKRLSRGRAMLERTLADPFEPESQP
jgi:RNA polymerase sigma-70 factor (ECF subfamily)